MFNLEIPGYGKLEIQNLVLDYNGTIARDGKLLEGVRDMINKLIPMVDVHIITADTYGTVEKEIGDMPVKVKIIKGDNELVEKRDYLKEIGPQITMAIGNGYNDQLLLREAKVSVVVVGSEACSTILLNIADLVVKDIYDAIGLLLNPDRLKASLRG